MGPRPGLKRQRELLRRVEQLHEFNPMMGHRGVRLGISYPEITEMQVRAIIEAACSLKGQGFTVVPEIMIPLVGHVKELLHQKAVVDRVAREVMRAAGVEVDYLLGTMIEVPRGAITAAELAEHSDFFSFGTNDLTQMTFGFSRDDSTKFLRVYRDRRILDRDPFASIDVDGWWRWASPRDAGRDHHSSSACAESTGATPRRSSSSCRSVSTTSAPLRIVCRRPALRPPRQH